jgi:hypothetical protein|tara:strand:- start:1822 stop:2244 length:423 start_codon:yes stop_codon:yes gene_type:complete
MIKYNLKCKNHHEFESWFSNSKEFENLKRKKLLDCIYCNSKDIDKTIMSPRIINKNQNIIDNSLSEKNFFKVKKDLNKLRKFIEKNFEFVGDKFPKKVREIYYNNNDKKNIYGTVTENEKKELQDEGIELVNVPWIDKNN